MAEASDEAVRRHAEYARRQGYRVEVEPCPKRVRVVFNGRTVADSERVLLLRETGHTPVYYFPHDDVRTELMRPTERRTFCPFKGEASYRTVEVGGRAAENAVWSYEDPIPEAAAIRGHLAFYWDRMDAWFEEDEEVVVHPRDPHVRIDVRQSFRPVRVVLGGETVAESHRTRFLYETGLPTRYYLPPEDVRLDLLEPSETRTGCPYKGWARYWSARVGGRLIKDVAWSYPEPLTDAIPVKGMICFFTERVDAIVVGGAPGAPPPSRA